MMELKIYSLLPINGKDKAQEKRRKRLSLVLSLLFHTLALFLSVKFFQPMGELFKEEQVRAVFLADRVELSIPEYLLRPGRLRLTNETFPSQGGDDEEKRGGELQDIPSLTREKVEEYLSSLYSRAVPSDPANVQLNPELLERFQLAPPNENRFRLSIPPEFRSETEEDMKESVAQKNLKDFLILSSAGANARFKKLLASSGLTDGFQEASPQASREKIKLNIQSWAERALEEIAMNWTLDPLLSQRLRGIVGISMTIARNGEILSIEIVKSSGYASLDQIALYALEASNPLPGLSEGFSDQVLALYFEFEYGNQ